ncbi:hypothetical protein TIFTF001_042315 [Ficus carica]|uniref:Transmembrane protein n=1 Tax=Ficus carica TaxID=3494 RepID=A0AA88DEW0_FICCA|nr:hypothetical protein TIFTF001_042315 [Ficus carica]
MPMEMDLNSQTILIDFVSPPPMRLWPVAGVYLSAGVECFLFGLIQLHNHKYLNLHLVVVGRREVDVSAADSPMAGNVPFASDGRAVGGEVESLREAS